LTELLSKFWPLVSRCNYLGKWNMFMVEIWLEVNSSEELRTCILW
jgi:hypothetical protein